MKIIKAFLPIYKIWSIENEGITLNRVLATMTYDIHSNSVQRY